MAAEPATDDALRISDLAARSGVAEGTLRQWETRYGFPEPRRLPSGHRRYGLADVDAVRRVAAARDAGLSLPAAIAQVREEAAPPPSIMAALRERRPGIETRPVPKTALLPMSRALEDEALQTGRRLVVVGAFQQERHYRASEERWRTLARAADAAVVFADFSKPRRPRGGPAEVPIPPRGPLEHEWAVICATGSWAACLVGWERPPVARVRDDERTFEVFWSVERTLVREAARAAAGLAGPVADELSDALDRHLAPASSPEDELRHLVALTNRMVGYVAAAH